MTNCGNKILFYQKIEWWYKWKWNTLKLRNQTQTSCPQSSLLSLTIQSVVLFIAAFAQDGGWAIVKDGRGLYGRQAACRDGHSTKWGVGFGWTGMCFCRWKRRRSERRMKHEERWREKGKVRNRERGKEDRKQVVIDKLSGRQCVISGIKW